MKIRLKRLNQAGFDHVVVFAVFIVLFALVGTFLLLESRAATPSCVNNTNTGSNRCVNLHFGSTSGNCLNGTTLTGCSNTSNDNMWINPTGSGFKLQNKNGQCLSEPGGHVQQKTIAQGGHHYPVAVVSCSSAYTNWNWAGGKLQNTSGERGCINSVSGNNRGSEIVMYNCNASNEIWKSVYVTAASGGGGGSSTCPSGYHASTTKAKEIAQCQLKKYGWSDQYSCLDNIYIRESGWVWSAANSSGAYGIPQSLPGSKMASAGSDWHDNAATQIKWGLAYIKSVYGTPCKAWSFWQGNHYYIEYVSPAGVKTRV